MSYDHSVSFPESAEPPPCSKGGGFLLNLECGCRTKIEVNVLLRLAETQPTLRHAFKHVYGFILQAVKGDRTTADAIFEDYLAGKLSKELLSISRRWVSTDQAASSKRESEEDWAADNQLSARAAGGVGVRDAFTALS